MSREPVLFNHTRTTSSLPPLRSSYDHFFIFRLTQGVCSTVKRKQRLQNVLQVQRDRPTQDLFNEAALIALDLANEYFPWKPGDRMSPMSAVSV